MEKQIIGQLVGVLGLVVTFCSFQCKESKKLFFFQMIGTAIFALHFILLEAQTAVMLNIGGIIRAFFLFHGDKKWARHPAALVGVTLMMAVFGFATWDGWLSLLPIVAMVGGTPFMWTQNGKTLRIAQLAFISPCWLTYNAAVFSIAGVVNETFTIISVVVSICRFGLDGLKREDASPRQPAAEEEP